MLSINSLQAMIPFPLFLGNVINNTQKVIKLYSVNEWSLEEKMVEINPGGTAHVRYRFDEDLEKRRSECACIFFNFFNVRYDLYISPNIPIYSTPVIATKLFYCHEQQRLYADSDLFKETPPTPTKVAQQRLDFSETERKPNIGIFLDLIIDGSNFEASTLKMRTGSLLATLQELARKGLEKTLEGRSYLDELKTELPQENNNQLKQEAFVLRGPCFKK